MSRAAVRLTDILICQFVSQSYSLRLMLDRLPVDDGMLELLDDRFVDGVALSWVSHIRSLASP